MTNELQTPQLVDYLESLVPERERELQSMEARAKESDFPIIGPAAGYFCYQLARIAGKLQSGGLLIIDNMLWSGRVFDARDNSRSTKGIREATRLLSESKEWVTTLVPIRDGLLVAYKR